MPLLATGASRPTEIFLRWFVSPRVSTNRSGKCMTQITQLRREKIRIALLYRVLYCFLIFRLNTVLSRCRTVRVHILGEVGVAPRLKWKSKPFFGGEGRCFGIRHGMSEHAVGDLRAWNYL